MKEDRSVLPVFKIAIFLLILKNAQGDTRQWHEESRRTSRNDDTASLRISGNRLFKQQNAIKITPHPSGSPKENENDKFIYPDLKIVRNRDHETYVPRIGEGHACSGKVFCENVSNYPTKLVNEVIRRRSIGEPEIVDAARPAGLKIGAAPTVPLCMSTERIVYPQAAKNVDKQWLYVINHPNYTQAIRTEACTNEGQMCNLIAGCVEGYVTTCEQNYIYRQLAAVLEDGSISHQQFQFPSSCSCHVRFVGFSSRSVDSQTTEAGVDTH